MIPSFRRIRSDKDDLSRVMDTTDESFKVIRSKAILDGRLITGVSITVGTKKVISHGLGRPLQGWIIIRQSADCNFWDGQASNPTPNNTLDLNSAHASTTTLTISLWVF